MENEILGSMEPNEINIAQQNPDDLAAGALAAEGKNVVQQEEAAPEIPAAPVEEEKPEKAPCGCEEKPEPATKTILSYLRDFVALLAGVVLIFSLLFRVVVVSGPSMKNTLYNGDYILLLNSALYTEPQYGDIIVACKDSFNNGEPIIKRVIATEGQRVDIDFDAGIVYVDGKALDEPYTNTPTNIEEGMRFPLVVNEGCVFVMGDNRNSSKDSRSLEIGQIDKREILGKALFLVFPGSPDKNTERDYSRIGALW